MSSLKTSNGLDTHYWPSTSPYFQREGQIMVAFETLEPLTHKGNGDNMALAAGVS